jgi:hypothetical protein
VAGPFAHGRFDDIDGDDRDELLTSGDGDEIVVWRFDGDFAARPAYRAELDGPVLDFAFTLHAPEFGWLAVVKTPRAFHALTLPRQ